MNLPAISGPFPPDFQFSQGNLQDYVDCPRRFQLRYLLRLAWPAPPAEPLDQFEKHVRDGDAFHRLVHQHILGLPVERLALMIGADDEALGRWWESYLDHAPADFPGAARHPEVALSTTVAGYRLVAKYDMVAVEPGGTAAIIDWKTGDRRPKRATLAARLQTRVYCYVMARAGAGLNGGHGFAPTQVQMIYWFPGHPDEPEVFRYDAVSYRADGDYLERLIREIAGQPGDAFAKTDDEAACRFCSYRSLCGRGERAGALADVEDDLPEGADIEPGFDFEQIGEIAF